MDDIKDFLAHAEESDLRHAYSRWSYATEPQKDASNRSQFWGNEMATLILSMIHVPSNFIVPSIA